MALSERQKKYIKIWEKRRKNKLLFAFINGSLIWGVQTVIFIQIINYIIGRNIFIWKTIYQDVPVFLVGGFFYGFWLYKINEKTYQNFLKQSSSKED